MENRQKNSWFFISVNTDIYGCKPHLVYIPDRVLKNTNLLEADTFKPDTLMITFLPPSPCTPQTQLPYNSIRNMYDIAEMNIRRVCRTCSSCPSSIRNHSCCRGLRVFWCFPSTCHTCSSCPSCFQSCSCCRDWLGSWCCPSTCHTCSSCPSCFRSCNCCRDWLESWPFRLYYTV